MPAGRSRFACVLEGRAGLDAGLDLDAFAIAFGAEVEAARPFFIVTPQMVRGSLHSGFSHVSAYHGSAREEAGRLPGQKG